MGFYFMGTLADFFIADRSAIPIYEGGAGFDSIDRCDCGGLGLLQAEQLLGLLREMRGGGDHNNNFELITSPEGQDFTMSVPADMVAILGSLMDDEIMVVAERLAQDTQLELDWSPQDFLPMLTALGILARRAVDGDRAMFYWTTY
jgi:hypothetical protein